MTTDVGASTIMFTLIGALVCYIITVIPMWKMFEKAGEKGWKAIIPVYNSYILYKISWNISMFFAMLVLGVVSVVLKSFDMTVLTVLGSILNLATAVISIVQIYYLSVSFGHGLGYAVGLLFLRVIFYYIIAFGSSQYQGVKGAAVSNNAE